MEFLGHRIMPDVNGKALVEYDDYRDVSTDDAKELRNTAALMVVGHYLNKQEITQIPRVTDELRADTVKTVPFESFEYKYRARKPGSFVESFTNNKARASLTYNKFDRTATLAYLEFSAGQSSDRPLVVPQNPHAK